MFNINKYKKSVAVITACLTSSASLEAGWSWNMVDNNTVYMECKENDNTRYTFELGAGGCIRYIIDGTNGDEDLLAGPFKDETTDRVLQNVFWIHDVLSGARGLSAEDQRWNVNQAGAVGANHSGSILSPTVDVEVDNGNAKTVIVYSAADTQFQDKNTGSVFEGSDPVVQCTIYTGLSDGVLSVRTITRCPKVYKNGEEQINYQTYLERWTAFKHDDANAFNSVCLGSKRDGSPTWNYTIDRVPIYKGWKDHRHNGWAFAYNKDDTSKTVLAMVFGDKTARKNSLPHVEIENVLNMLTWAGDSPGLGILPGINSSNTVAGSFIDSEYRIILRPGTDYEFITRIQQSEKNVASTHIYGPDYNFNGKNLLKEVTRTLDRIVSDNIGGVRTHSIGRADRL